MGGLMRWSTSSHKGDWYFLLNDALPIGGGKTSNLDIL